MRLGIHGSVNSQTVKYCRDLGDGFSLFMDWRHKPFKYAALMREMTSFCCRPEQLLCQTQYSNIGFNSSQNNQQGNVMTSKSTSQRTDYSHKDDFIHSHRCFDVKQIMFQTILVHCLWVCSPIAYVSILVGLL